MKKIAFVVSHYPSKAEPTRGAFVKEIVHSFSRLDIHCMVVQPVPWPRSRDRAKFPFHTIESSENNGCVEIVRPSCLPVPMIQSGAMLGVFNPNKLKFRSFVSSVETALKQMAFCPDAIYGHFLYFGGGAAINIGRQRNIASFIGVGEGEFWSVIPLGRAYARKHLQNASGILPNASHLLRKLAMELQIDAAKMEAFPNGVNLTQFHPLDRQEARRLLGLPRDLFIVGGVGNFLYKKGLVRVGQAIDGVEGVIGIFAGSGPEPPIGKNVFWAKPLPHDQLPIMLSACDVFVLPTLIEGCCNALIEAMACGLPIISSDSEYTEDLLTDDCAIRIDPLNVEAIRDSIITLRDDPERRQRMAEAALDQASKFDINVRAKKILEFMRIKSDKQFSKPNTGGL